MYDVVAQRLMLAALLQYSAPGVPCIYYGDEAGLEGFADPHNRRSYPWGREDDRLLRFYQQLGRTYSDCPELRSGDFEYLSPDSDIFICRRSLGEWQSVAVVNRSDLNRTVELTGVDLLTGRQISGELTLPPRGCALVRLRVK